MENMDRRAHLGPNEEAVHQQAKRLFIYIVYSYF